MHSRYCVIGLGNPGVQYEDTRHNIGWMVCNSLLSKVRSTPLTKGRGQWLESSFTYSGTRIDVILPLTYMNNSGKAAAEVGRLFRILPEHIIAIVDEYNFPTGKVHLKKGGSDGGHNGIASLIQELGTPNFYRLRCGIDKNFDRGGLVDYVLAPFAPDEKEKVNAMIEQAVEAVLLLCRVGASKAMNTINAGPANKKETPPDNTPKM